MDSVQGLRARIEAISSEIDLQKELLKKLERDKSLAQRQLNAVLDPVARLPPEISSEIFLYSLPSIPERPAAHNVPMLLLNVCHSWTDIATSIPALWATICVPCPCAAGFEEGSRAWLQRAGNRPLSVFLRGKFGDGDVPAVVWEHSDQLEHLDISEHLEDAERLGPEAFDMGILDLVGTQSPRSLRLLRSLVIRGSGLESGQFSGGQILKILRMAPNLRECTFQDMRLVSEDGIDDAVIVLPALRRLMFPGSDDQILQLLTLPTLVYLSVPLDNVSGQDLLQFFRRSSPPLEELTISYPNLTADQLGESIPFLQTLERLEAFSMEYNVLDALLHALNGSEATLPNLQMLRIRISGENPSSSSWNQLLRATSSRPQLRIVHVELAAYSDSAKPSTEILAAFRNLRIDGRQIHIGSRDENCI
ncbi:hypothetical protein DFH06DRAFT_1388981 [Mycena polygramma]|nr:hypothetical protein DFH06DRAFT_1388981 [Mycena polygramma]